MRYSGHIDRLFLGGSYNGQIKEVKDLDYIDLRKIEIPKTKTVTNVKIEVKKTIETYQKKIIQETVNKVTTWMTVYVIVHMKENKMIKQFYKYKEIAIFKQCLNIRYLDFVKPK